VFEKSPALSCRAIARHPLRRSLAIARDDKKEGRDDKKEGRDDKKEGSELQSFLLVMERMRGIP